ncbi:hypothetical protein [Tenacibaculum piscium]|uniref:hypothetical protein n=1 Tax=Tenacibaculum piscium TaxID=1458515 RepID=UPI001F1FA116|nr:hypothetical protein [Tenacibaculum piscium]
MTKQLKHNYFNYFLFVFLILKGVSCIANNLQILDNTFENSLENSLTDSQLKINNTDPKEKLRHQNQEENQNKSNDKNDNKSENQLENQLENELEKELDEHQEINQILVTNYHFYQNKASNNYSAIFKKYSIQYLELTTQPPEFL